LVRDGQEQKREGKKSLSKTRIASWWPGASQNGARQVLTVTFVEEGTFGYRLFSLSQGRVSLLLDYSPESANTDVPGAFRAAGHSLRYGLDVILLLPRRQVHIKHLPVPTQDRDQIARMVPYEANVQSPWPREDTIHSYEILEGTTAGYSTLVLYLARLAWVEACLVQLAAQNVRPTQVEVSTRGLERLLGGATIGAGASLLLSAAGETEYLRLLPGGGSFSRAASAEAERPQETLQRSLELSEKSGLFRGACDTLILAGCPVDTAHGLPAERTPGQVTMADDVPFPALDGPGTAMPQLLLGAGAALLADAPVASANLLPASYLRWLEPRRLLRRARTTGLLLLWFAGLLGALGYYHYQDQIARAEVARARIEALGAGLGDLEAKSETLRLLRGEQKQVSLPLALVLELYDKTPSQIAVNNMRMESRGLLILGCEAPDFQALFAFLEALKSSAMLEQVELINSSQPQHAAGGLVEFKVQAQLRAAKGEKKP
jgi:hypothetical protein